MAARWHRAHNLCLNLAGSPLRQEIALAIMSAQPSPGALTQLQLEWADSAASDDPDAAIGLMLLTWLAAHAHGLRSLCLSVFQLPALPPLPNLRHLILNHASPHLAAAARDISCLTALQTLCISTVSWSDEAQELELALGGLRQLRQVKLEGILPALLELPLDAALHVTVFDEWSAEHPVWQSVLPNMRTFKWDDDTWSLSRLPGVLQAPSGLTRVLLRMHAFGSSQRPLRLRAAGSPAASICLACRDAWVDLDGTTWRHVCITADRVVLSGTQSCPECCPDFYLEYFALEESPSEPLVVVPKRLGCWGATCSRTPICGGRERLWKGTNECLHVGFDYLACTCGACIECLVRSGAVSSPCFC